MDDIDALLKDAGEELAELRGLYEQAVREAESYRIKPRIKNILESHRSALGFLAVQIYGKHGSGKPNAKVYYPVADSPSAFPAWFEKNLPGVAANAPNVRDATKTGNRGSPATTGGRRAANAARVAPPAFAGDAGDCGSSTRRHYGLRRVGGGLASRRCRRSREGLGEAASMVSSA
jgi:hypothetical protein